MRHALAFPIALSAILLILGCSGSSNGEKEITINSPKKLPLKIALYVPDTIAHGIVQVVASGGCKDANTTTMNEGESYSGAISSGLATAFTSVTLMPRRPTTQEMHDRFDVLAVASLGNSLAAANITEEELTTTYIHCQYQTSVLLHFTDKYGDSLYTFKADGSGAYNEKGPCSALHSVFQVAVDTALSQISSYIARSAYSGAPLAAYAKNPK